ncbi:MAG: PIG-L deacetylase family protein [archaeon]
MAKNILVLCAHNDDQILGAGGTLAKFAKEGMKITTVIFSYGEGSHPWLKREEVIRMRVKECSEANKVIGGGDVIYLGLKEGLFNEEIEAKNIKEKIKRIILRKKPIKIFTHSIDDPHPNHQAVYKATLDIVGEIGHSCNVYSFNVWNIINIRKRNSPKLVVDITDTFRYKVEAFKCHKSQKPTRISLMWNVYFQAWLNGLKNNVRYAEVFYKL